MIYSLDLADSHGTHDHRNSSILKMKFGMT